MDAVGQADWAAAERLTPAAAPARTWRDRTQVLAIGGDVRRLRALRTYIDGLDVYECMAIASAAPGLNALVGRPWAVALLLDDLPNLRPEQLIATARALECRTPVVVLLLTADPRRAHAVYQAGAVEVLSLGNSLLPEVGRTVARTIERQSLLDRVSELEASIDGRQLIDEETGLYPRWRFDEELALEAHRTMRRRGDLGLLQVEVVTVPPLERLPDKERSNQLRRVGMLIRGALRDGDVGGHDGEGHFRALLVDSGPLTTDDVAETLRRAVKHGFDNSGMNGLVAVDVADAQAAAEAVAQADFAGGARSSP